MGRKYSTWGSKRHWQQIVAWSWGEASCQLFQTYQAMDSSCPPRWKNGSDDWMPWWYFSWPPVLQAPEYMYWSHIFSEQNAPFYAIALHFSHLRNFCVNFFGPQRVQMRQSRQISCLHIFPNLMIIAPRSTHLSITFFFSGSVGVNLGPPGISTCENICFRFCKTQKMTSWVTWSI